jgi:cysteine-rich repeat protein
MRRAAIAVAALALGATTAGAQDISKCRAAIVKGAQKYASARAKALQKCEEGRLTGKITTTCDADAKTQGKISAAASKLQDAIAKACTSVTVADLGFDNLVNRCSGGIYDGQYCVTNGQCPGVCVGGSRNGELCTGAGNCPGGTCPNVGTCGQASICPAFLNDHLGASCAAPLTSPADVGTCIACTTARKVDSLMRTFYGSLLPASADKAVLKCQKDIGKRTAKYFDAVEKALAKCEQDRIKDPMVTCPDAKAADKIAKAGAKLDAAIAKTCLDAGTISGGLRPSQVLGEASRFGACGAANTQTAAGLSAALGCLAKNAASCDVGLTVGDAACSTLLCGNGQIDSGETCDDGNTVADGGVGPDDICPPDCAVAACSPTGTQSVTVQLTTSTPLVSALVLVTYDDTKVSIPGIADSPSVLASVSSGVFATSPRDTDTAIRINLEDPTLTGVSSGAAATVTFTTCTGTPVTAADFTCVVVSAGDANFAEVFGASCAVTVP